MRIGIDGLVFQWPGCGIQQYVYNLCKELDKILPDAHFFVYSNKPIALPVNSKKWVVKIDTSFFASYLKPVFWLKTRVGSTCKNDNLDVFWSGAVFLPTLPSHIKKVTTVYDINFKIVPETMGSTHLWAHKIFFERDIKKADRVIAISKGTAEKLFKLFGREADAIINPGVDARFRPQTKEEISSSLLRYNITPPYLLSVATWEPRKNLELLIKVFVDLKKEGVMPKHKLVLVGGRGWKDDRLNSMISESNRSFIIPLGYIPNENLPPLYAGSDAFIFPSIYEGFGIPVLEARACETQIITTDIPELHEAGGSNAIYIRPTEEGIRKSILMLQQTRRSAYALPDDLPSWSKGAQILANVLQGALNERGFK